MKHKLGAKIFTKNVETQKSFVLDIIQNIREGIFDYLEVYAFPEAYTDEVRSFLIKNLADDVPVIVHAAHLGHGFNPSDKEQRPRMRTLFAEAQRIADDFKAPFIVTHTGVSRQEGGFEEVLHQFKSFNDPRLAVENTTYYSGKPKGMTDEEASKVWGISLGCTPSLIAKIKQEVGCHFCLDFSHLKCSANTRKADKTEDLKAFCALNPDMLHICDGEWNGTEDAHFHLGDGDFDIPRMLSFVPNAEIPMTIETGQKPETETTPWIKDAEFLRSIK
ncbi:MAG: hypothetical protein EOM53_04405 [Alphaproteobacteria bacterium]|nr:hypothetical protein [Alphaproteobacteria bacterium]